MKVWLIVSELILTNKLAVHSTFIASLEADCNEIADYSKLTDSFKELKMRYELERRKLPYQAKI